MPALERQRDLNTIVTALKKQNVNKAANTLLRSSYLPANEAAYSYYGNLAAQNTGTKKKTKKPAAKASPSASASSSSYRPYSYSGSSGSSYGSYSSGGGGGGGTAGREYEQYGITKPWMDAYKEFWGSVLPQKLWGMYEPVTSLFTRYMNRLPQLDDWQKIWQAAQDYYAANEIDRKQMPLRLELYEPFISGMVRQPLFTPPDVSYGAGTALSF